MSEDTLIRAIKTARTKAIERADIKHAKHFIQSKKPWLLIFTTFILLIISICLLISALGLTPSINVNYPVEHVETTLEKTIQVTNEVTYTGSGEMTCIEVPDTNKLTCYRNI